MFATYICVRNSGILCLSNNNRFFIDNQGNCTMLDRCEKIKLSMAVFLLPIVMWLVVFGICRVFPFGSNIY